MGGGIQIETEKEGWGGDTNRDAEGGGVETDTISNLVFYAQIETGGGGGGGRGEGE